jgi:hypothetical protein
MNALPAAPNAFSLAARLGYSPNEMALDEEMGTIYFPMELRVSFPTKRSFIRLPRFANDGFSLDDKLLRALAESELMRAIEDHNAKARSLREKESA